MKNFFTKGMLLFSSTKITVNSIIKNPKTVASLLKIVKYFYKTIPILGVCLGHQVIGQVFGARIVGAKKLMHGKTSSVISKKIGILTNIPKKFEATRYHSLIVDKKTLSKDFIITSKTKDGIIMGIKHKTYDIEGVQFHPESILTKEGKKLIKNILKR